ncbi:linker for activation of T-cells family member 2-like [Emydura macquarii macquarii]|uniref:linker for activation of T-cells family member 2-like n=1 Tax=Emydura macquarii macquarii TaxID=1129001 RepID=UPI00352B311F
MSQVELLWAAASLMLLGALVSMCMKCQRSATKREKNLSKQRNLHENQQRFEVIRSYSIATTRQDQIKLPDNIPVTRKTNERLQTTGLDDYDQTAESFHNDADSSDLIPVALRCTVSYGCLPGVWWLVMHTVVHLYFSECPLL